MANVFANLSPMQRTARAVAAEGYYHVLNRGKARGDLFYKEADFDAFCRILAEAQTRYPVQLLAWCLMPNHWHLVVRPMKAAALAGFMGWVGVTHVRRHHEHYHSRGGGHLYQGRFKSFPTHDDEHFLTLCRYVEANPLRANLVTRAQDWRWSSLAAAPDAEPGCWPVLTEWPVDRPKDWEASVNASLPKQTLGELRTSVNRGRPFGPEAWVQAVAKRLGLTHTLRGPGRPRKQAELLKG